MISCHEEFFRCKAPGNYVEAGHGKVSWDSIGGRTKRKADQPVKNCKYIIQDALDFYELSKQDSSVIKFIYLSIDYEISEVFRNAV